MNKDNHLLFDFKSQDPSTSLLASLPFGPQAQTPCTTHPLRISDVLELDEDFDDVWMGSRPGIDRPSPRRNVGRWLSNLLKGKAKALSSEGERKIEKGSNFKSGEKEKERKSSGRTAEAVCSVDGIDGRDLVASVSALESGESGLGNKETSFNLGVGCCLLYLIAASKNELGKMIETRVQMETLLQNVRDELRKKDEISKPSELNDVCNYSTTDVPEDADYENQFSPQISTTSYVLPESPSVTVSSQSLIYETPKRNECLCLMNQLEAELKSELEQLEFHLDDETLSGTQQQQSIQGRMEDTISSEGHSVSSGEVIDPQDTVDYVVPAPELERRLHELLQSRQQEEIRELEAALECVKQKLLEKEIEVSWWKDTARVISKRIPEHSRPTLQYDPKTCSSQM